MQNNFFSINRMGMYLRKEISDNYKTYLLSIALMLALGVGIALFAFANLNQWEKEIKVSHILPVYIIFFTLFIGLDASRSFNALAKTERRMDFFLLPASKFEKVLGQYLITFIFVSVIFHCCAWVSFQTYQSLVVTYKQAVMIYDWDQVFPPKFTYGNYLQLMLGLHAAFFFGATFFYRFSFPKIFFCFLIFLFGIWFINIAITNALFGKALHDWYTNLPYFAIFTGNDRMHNFAYVVPEWLGRANLFIAQFLLIPALWVLSYFRISDKEIQ
ncbi:hypothetical protein [Chitinophaga sp. CB10]|uniref:hypothetical protein n=1 Tax=Chitinophaga sp. CB10 TaxID=1891659 RepID=UPI0025C1D4CF|nr:hypothetical protein [Chitinophaga sp. CB10]